MAIPTYMSNAAERPRQRVKRSRGRRSTDRRPSLETVLIAGVFLAWAWGMYEVTLIFLR